MTRSEPGHADVVNVPNLVGLTVSAARRHGHDAGVVVAAQDPDGPPLGSLTWPGVWVVTAQSPRPGAVRRRNEFVVVSFEEQPGHEAGDSEPRRPVPPLDELGGERRMDDNGERPGERWPSPH